MPILLSATHALDFLITSLFLGSVVCTQFVLKGHDDPAEPMDAKTRARTRALGFILFLTSSAWTLLTASDMAESWEPTNLWTALGQTNFGHLWCIRLILIAILAFVAPRFRNTPWAKVYVVLVCTLPLFATFTGHASAQGSVLRTVADYLHALAAGIWTGGLFSLLFWLSAQLSAKGDAAGVIQAVVERFSKVAMGSVAIIFVSGILMTYQGGVDFLHPWATDYGRLILAKVALFLLALGAAGLNQFIHLRKWKTAGETLVATHVSREVKLELALIVFIFAVAGFLTRTDLPLLVSSP